MERYKAIANFSVGEQKYFKGHVYNELPHTMRNFFIEINDEKKSAKIEERKVETASIKAKSVKRKK